MSKLERLLEELCPDGVEYKTIDNISTRLKGMSGVSKKWYESGNCQFIEYKNVYQNLKINIYQLPYATVKKLDSQTILNQGDILFTSASETPNECAISSVIEDIIKEGVFLDDHLFGIRLRDKNVNPVYLNYYCHTNEFRKKVSKVVRGVTRFYVSLPDFMKIKVPVPPLPIQEEIVRILDSFTELKAQLEEELEARKKQYEWYRDSLLSCGSNTPVYKLKEVAQYSKAKIDAKDVDEHSYIGVDNLLLNKKGKTTSSYVPSEGRLTKYNSGDILIGNIRPYLRKIWFSNVEGGTNGDVLTIQVTSEKVLPRYLFFQLSSESFFRYDIKNSKGAKMPRGNKDAIMRYEIPIPPLEEQQRIVDILDRFDKLCNDISEGLPAEIDARQKQYEYYRDKLLTFKGLEDREGIEDERV